MFSSVLCVTRMSGCRETWEAATSKAFKAIELYGSWGDPFLSQKSVSKTDLFDKDFETCLSYRAGNGVAK